MITLNGDSPHVVSLNSAYTDPGAIVTDDVDSPTTISGSGDVNTRTVGNYTITYSTTDSAGNVAVTVTRVVRVVDYSEMITVQGGTLPEGSELVGETVEDFKIGKYEVTWAEWKEIRDWAVNNGYTDLVEVGGTDSEGSADNFPVVNVSWYDACKWSNAKSEKEGLKPVYQVSGVVYKTGESVPSVVSSANGYRLPLEKEWEWAARGGLSSQGYTYSGSDNVNKVAWYWENISDNRANAVGTKDANELDIHDMSGNAYEWNWDLVDSSERRLRGGSWFDDASSCTVAYRPSNGQIPNSRHEYWGFRLARSSGN